MDADTLAALEHQNMIEALAAAGGLAPGAIVRRSEGVALIANGLPLRLFNQVLVEAEDVRPDAIAAAVSVTRGRADPFVVNLRVGTDDRYRPLMEELGLVRMSDAPWMPGMGLHPLPATGTRPPTPGHEIRRIVDAAGIADHIQTAAAGFGMPVEWLAAIMGEPLLAREDMAIYVGYSDGVPVTTGLGVRTGRTIGVYNIATVESARRQGLGGAMTMRIVDDGAADGADVAILQSSDMGFTLYEDLGFHTVVEYDGFIDPPPPGSGSDSEAT